MSGRKRRRAGETPLDDDSQDEGTAATMISKMRHVDNTLKGYASKVNNIRLFIISRPDLHVALDDDNSLNPAAISQRVLNEIFSWLATNVDLPRDAMQARRDAAMRLAADEGDQDENIFDISKNLPTVAVSTMQGYKSALVNYYEKRKVVWPIPFDNFVENFIDGYEKLISEKKESGVMKMQEGKSHMQFGAFNEICRYILKISPPTDKGVITRLRRVQVTRRPQGERAVEDDNAEEATDSRRGNGRGFSFYEFAYGHLFMILCWNLMGRSHSIGAIHLAHLNWVDDCLTIEYAKSKSDQKGKSKGNLKHIYGNPLSPNICPILSLGIYLFCFGRNSGGKLFEGKFAEDRFSKILKKLLVVIPGIKQYLGAKVEDIGTHSNRKGSVSYSLSFVTISAVQVYLRAGWSLGNVPDRYIFAGPGGDQIVGRTVAGLPVNDQSFAVLPPHFSSESLEELNALGWSSILSDYDSYPACFKNVVPFLLASVLYHLDYFRGTLNSEHPFWNSRLFQQNGLVKGRLFLEYFKERVLLGYGRCPVTNMQATGIPPHLVVSNEVYQLRLECRQQAEHLKEYVSEAINELLTTVNANPSKTKEMICENFNIEGVMPLTRSDLTSTMKEIAAANNSSLLKEIEEMIRMHNPTTETVNERPVLQLNGFDMEHKWPGEIVGRRLIPADFVFPSLRVKFLWDCWHYGHRDKRIAPYRLLGPDIIASKNKKSMVNYSRASVVIRKMTTLGETLGKISPDPEVIYSTVTTIAENDLIFDSIFEALVDELYPVENRKKSFSSHQTVYSTFANKLYNNHHANIDHNAE